MTEPDKHGWLPIESAPRDGTWVLLYGVHGIDMARYERPYGWWRFETAEYDNEAREVVKPTYFQPLPPPPEDA